MRTFLYFFFALLLFFSFLTEGKASTQSMPIHGARYGEMIVVTGGPFNFTGHVYNTLGLNNCPDALWETLKPQEFKKKFKARAVTLNGPRYFLMDEVSTSHLGKIASFGSLQGRHVADVAIPLSTVIKGGVPPYIKTPVLGTGKYSFHKGSTIYELISPKGKTYVMQSYPQNSDASFKESDLANIEQNLSLPAGWKYRSRILDKDLTIKAAAKTYIIRDKLNNSYQKE